MPIPLIAAILLAASPVQFGQSVEVDCIELESVYDQQGNHLFDQVLARNFEAETGCCEVASWRMAKKDGEYPRPDGEWTVVRWTGPIGREVRSKAFVRSWHQFDAEVAERRRWPITNRRDIFGDRQPTPAPAITPDQIETARRWFGNDPLPPAPEGMP